MAINVLQAAKHVCKRAGWELSQLEVHKILYIAHMIQLGTARGPLVSGEFQAWKHGPVHPILYQHTSYFGTSPISEIAFDDDIKDLSYDTQKIEAENLDKVVETFPPGSGPKLRKITHQEIGAWYKCYEKRIRNIPIPNKEIREEYDRRISEEGSNND